MFVVLYRITRVWSVCDATLHKIVRPAVFWKYGIADVNVELMMGSLSIRVVGDRTGS